MKRNYVEFTVFALTATAFCIVALVAIIAYGSPEARHCAIAAAILAALSQFIAPSAPRSLTIFRLSLLSAYAAFVCAFAGLAFMLTS